MNRDTCPSCSYVYDEATGDEHEGFPAGTPWREVPDDWCCPDCGVREKVDFEPAAATFSPRSAKGTGTPYDGFAWGGQVRRHTLGEPRLIGLRHVDGSEHT